MVPTRTTTIGPVLMGTSTASVASMPQFTVIVAVFNGVATLQRCIDSVAAQPEGVAELVVVDGGSWDGTVDVLGRNRSHIAHWESEPDRGICHAWNKAIRRSNGDWILFLGADDWLAAPDTLNRAAALLDILSPDVRVAYGRVDLVDAQDRITGQSGRPWQQTAQGFYSSNTVPHQAVLHRRSLFDEIGGFDERFEVVGDYELLVRAFAEYPPVFIDLTISGFRLGGLSERADRAYQTTREAHRARYVNGLERMPEYFSPRIWRATAFEVVRRTMGLDVARRLSGLYHRR